MTDCGLVNMKFANNGTTELRTDFYVLHSKTQTKRKKK